MLRDVQEDVRHLNLGDTEKCGRLLDSYLQIVIRPLSYVVRSSRNLFLLLLRLWYGFGGRKSLRVNSGPANLFNQRPS